MLQTLIQLTPERIEQNPKHEFGILTTVKTVRSECTTYTLILLICFFMLSYYCLLTFYVRKLFIIVYQQVITV